MVETVQTDIQRKYRYHVNLDFSNDDLPDQQQLLVDDFTPPEKRFEAVTSQNQGLGQVVLSGPVSYGEMTLRLALRIASEGTSSDQTVLLDSLQRLLESTVDTVDVTLILLEKQKGTAASYRQSYQNCKLTGYRIDALGRNQDDDMLHVEVTLMPSRVNLLGGPQTPGG